MTLALFSKELLPVTNVRHVPGGTNSPQSHNRKLTPIPCSSSFLAWPDGPAQQFCPVSGKQLEHSEPSGTPEKLKHWVTREKEWLSPGPAHTVPC